MARNEDFAWAAGIIDGEGHFNHKSNKAPYPRFKVGQSSVSGTPQMFVRLKEMFPMGHIQGPFKSLNPKNKPIYAFTVYGFQYVQHVLASTWNWLGQEKRNQAASALRAYREYHNG